MNKIYYTCLLLCLIFFFNNSHAETLIDCKSGQETFSSYNVTFCYEQTKDENGEYVLIIDEYLVNTWETQYLNINNYSEYMGYDEKTKKDFLQENKVVLEEVIACGFQTKDSYLSVRKGPSASSKEITKLYLMDKVNIEVKNILNSEDNWYYVILNNGQRGWVYGEYLCFTAAG